MRRHRLTPLLWEFTEQPAHPEPPPRTFVLAPFGGGSAYALGEWVPDLRAPGERVLALQYPGRGPRSAEPHATDLTALADAAANDIAAATEGPLVLVGHSLGAVLGYEIAHRLHDLGRPVELLAVSAARPPDLQRLDPAAVLAMTRDDWIEELATGGNAELGESPLAEVADLAIPVLRADYLLLARYRPGPPRPLTCPLLALGGAADPWVARPYLDAWRSWTTGPFAAAVLPGDHFYYRGATAAFGGLIRARLRHPVTADARTTGRDL
ncbi:alpha/beta fold hydrolase [Streptomyces sp. RS10V-4]|uniref:thioesterase II family protein n=1 Tax=Streptomyces rhizoryzae TaxID=2932493 RepID=UPI002006426A|nr:alpha/beta fold hydrolase [Streptomyces rhizoryzae]MCK7621799.1 alpha/beta fold hydrolase [Streptomyces rhizoryzae]